MSYRILSYLKRVFLIILLFKLPFPILAQFEISDIEPGILQPSPTASELGRYGEIPVSLSSGIPNVSIPLTSFKARDIEVPISLSYYSGGLKVTSYNTWVGMGWSLNAGGVVTRTVKDQPDDAEQVPYPDDMVSVGVQQVDYIVQARDNLGFDSELDSYAFNFMGYSGKFVIDRDGQAIIYPRQNMTIERRIDKSITKDNRIIITTSDGTIFTFGGPDATEYSRASWSGANCGKNYDTAAETAFYLIKVERPSGTVVNFEYTGFSRTYFTGISETAKNIITVFNPCGAAQESTPNNYISSCRNTLEVTEKRLSRIYADGFGEILFDRGESTLLQNISDYSGQSLKGTYVFDYLSTDNNRIFLNSVKEFDATSSDYKMHVFEYDDVEGFPVADSYGQDHWGFYNAANNTTLLNGTAYASNFSGSNPFASYTADREPNLEATLKGTLTKITYPTGGSTTFEYELNETLESKWVYPASVYFNASVTGSESLSDDDFSSVRGTVEETYPLGTCEFSQIVEGDMVTVALVDEELLISDDSWIVISDKTDNVDVLNTRSNAGESIDFSFSIEEGHEYELTLTTSLGTQASLQFDYYDEAPEWQEVSKTVGGLRLNHMIDHDAYGGEKVKEYYYGQMTDLSTSVGEIRSQPSYYQTTVSLVPCEGTHAVGNTYVINTYGQLHSSSLANLYLNSGSHIAYRYVNVSYGSNFESGGIQHKFDISVDTPGQLIYGNYFQNQPLNNSAWNHGQELENIVYKKINGENVILSHTINEYELDNRSQTRGKSLVIRKNFDVSGNPLKTFQCDDDPNNDEFKRWECKASHDHYYAPPPPIAWGDFKKTNGYTCVSLDNNGPDYQEVIYLTSPCKGKTSADKVVIHDSSGLTDVIEYYFTNYWSYLSQTTQIAYDENGENPVTTITDFIYNNPVHLELTRNSTSNEDGARIITNELRYPQDYDYEPESTLNTMVTSGMTGIPLEKTQYVDDVVVASQAVQYEHIESDDLVVPKKFYSYETTTPGLGFSNSVDGESFDAYELKGEVLKRDEYGNILSFQKDNNIIVNYIWGYHKSFPVAKIENAAYGDIESFVEGIQIASDADDDQCTGQETCNESALRDRLEELRTSSILDEAIVTTYTYDLGRGITSQTDANGQTRYYEYDDFGRLQYERDQAGDVLQAFEYNYVEQNFD